MRYGFRSGAAEAIRLAKQYAEANGMAGLNCVDAWPCDQPPGTIREKGIIHWTARFEGLPRGPFDDGSIIVLARLETGEVRRLSHPKTA
jgi:hypothetical protein